MIEIDTQPAANPLEIPSPLPSTIVRNWPDAMTCKRGERIEGLDGTLAFCSAGILLETAGFDWSQSSLRQTPEGTVHSPFGPAALSFLWEKYGISREDAQSLARIHDALGKDMAADYLQAIGH